MAQLEVFRKVNGLHNIDCKRDFALTTILSTTLTIEIYARLSVAFDNIGDCVHG